MTVSTRSRKRRDHRLVSSEMIPNPERVDEALRDGHRSTVLRKF